MHDMTEKKVFFYRTNASYKEVKWDIIECLS